MSRGRFAMPRAASSRCVVRVSSAAMMVASDEGLDEAAGRVPEVSDRGRREDDHALSLDLAG